MDKTLLLKSSHQSINNGLRPLKVVRVRAFVVEPRGKSCLMCQNVTFVHEEEDNKRVIIAKTNSRLAYQVRLKLNQKENA